GASPTTNASINRFRPLSQKRLEPRWPFVEATRRGSVEPKQAARIARSSGSSVLLFSSCSVSAVDRAFGNDRLHSVFANRHLCDPAQLPGKDHAGVGFRPLRSSFEADQCGSQWSEIVLRTADFTLDRIFRNGGAHRSAQRCI